MKAALRFFLIVGTLSAIIVLALYYSRFAEREHPFKFRPVPGRSGYQSDPEVEIRGSEIRVIRRDATKYRTFAPVGYNSYNLVADLAKTG